MNNTDTESALAAYDIATARQIRKYGITGAGHEFNDLTMSPSDEIYLTDTPAGSIWYLANPPLLSRNSPGKFPAANGIALSSDGKLPYVSSYPDGVSLVDLTTGTVAPLAHPANLCLATIDGLVFPQPHIDHRPERLHGTENCPTDPHMRPSRRPALRHPRTPQSTF
jgi:hypothetical protein